MPSDSAIPLLWHFPVSHFNEKARWGLDWKGIPHRRKALFLDYVPRAFFRTRQLRLPILIIGGKAVADSTRILATLEERWPDPPLYPADPELRDQALALEDFFDEEVGHPVRTLLLGDLWRRDPARAIAMSGALEARGFLITAIRPPTVPEGTARLRITLTAAHEASDIDHLLEALASITRCQEPI